MRDVTEKNKAINKLVDSEILRLKEELDKNIRSLQSVEQSLPNLKSKLAQSENSIKDYKSNIASIENQIALYE